MSDMRKELQELRSQYDLVAARAQVSMVHFWRIREHAAAEPFLRDRILRLCDAIEESRLHATRIEDQLFILIESLRAVRRKNEQSEKVPEDG